MKTSCYRMIMVISSCVLLLLGFTPRGFAEQKGPLVLVSTFPIYQITRNVAQGRPITLNLMLPAELGCPHNYALTPQDMMKLSKARALVVNGLGMEEFLGPALKKANPSLKIIDSSQGITNLMAYTDHGHDQGEAHRQSRTNPHLFVSPGMASLLAMNVAFGLSKIDPEGASVYQANSKAYAERMNALDKRCRDIGKKLAHKLIITEHGVFDYLARDMGLTVAEVIESHSGSEPSASEMLHLINIIKTKKIRAIFMEPRNPHHIALALAKETGIRVASLDPGATGPLNADLTYYETLMEKNLKTLKENLGVLSDD